MPGGYGPPLLDFSPLGRLGETFEDAHDRAVRRRQDAEAPAPIERAMEEIHGQQARGAPLRRLGGRPSAPQPARAGSLPALGQQGRTPAFAGVSGVPGGQPGGFQGDLARYADAIASVESKGSGDYGAVGPTHPQYGRALGRYQVMEANIPQWSREALGREVTAEEFIADPQIQDAIFRHRFGGYVRKYGNPQDAASAWFTGRPRGVMGSDTARDSLGTSGSRYVAKFDRALGNSPADMPAPGARPAQFQVPGSATVQQSSVTSGMREAIKDLVRDPRTRARGIQLRQQVRKGENVRTVDLGGAIGIMDGQGNILRQIPKQQNPTDLQRNYRMAKEEGFTGSFMD